MIFMKSKFHVMRGGPFTCLLNVVVTLHEIISSCYLDSRERRPARCVSSAEQKCCMPHEPQGTRACDQKRNAARTAALLKRHTTGPRTPRGIHAKAARRNPQLHTNVRRCFDVQGHGVGAAPGRSAPLESRASKPPGLLRRQADRDACWTARRAQGLTHTAGDPEERREARAPACDNIPAAMGIVENAGSTYRDCVG
jgi:hypothetical protein